MRIHIWPDGVWAYSDELGELLQAPCAKSDDYETHDIPDETSENIIGIFVEYQLGNPNYPANPLMGV